MLAGPTGAMVEVVAGGEAPTLGAVVVVSVEPVVLLELADDGGADVVDALVVDVLVVVLDFGGATVVVVVVVVVVVTWWETGLVFGAGSGGYWM